MENGLALTPLQQQHIDQLQRVQNAALRCLFGVSSKTNISTLHLLSNLPTMAPRNHTLNASFYFQLHQSNDITHLAVTTYCGRTILPDLPQSFISQSHQKNPLPFNNNPPVALDVSSPSLKAANHTPLSLPLLSSPDYTKDPSSKARSRLPAPGMLLNVALTLKYPAHMPSYAPTSPLSLFLSSQTSSPSHTKNTFWISPGSTILDTAISSLKYTAPNILKIRLVVEALLDLTRTCDILYNSVAEETAKWLSGILANAQQLLAVAATNQHWQQIAEYANPPN
ncbi:hypothetical protein BC829DRAFT_440069 [Chytridium lagenaria]|nr:hypothetical protein BC829DRAFT_440069 [Chytridium lagenaria]